jgi:HD-GYP domain-containing protein (c-di-GMP phosphodiesterase class II)
MANSEFENSIRLSDVISALSVALDLTEGQPMGHAIRSCILGMRIAKELGLSAQDCSDLYYALLLKDSGCSTNSARLHQILGSDEITAKREVKLEDWTKLSLSGARYLWRNVLPGSSLAKRLKRILQVALHQKSNNAELIGARCERGAEIARKIGLSENTAEAIRSLDEHWDGGGYPEGLERDQVPYLAQIMNVSQTAEVYIAQQGTEAAMNVVSERSGKWFNPEIVSVVRSLRADSELWRQITALNAREFALQMEPGTAIPASPERIDSLCQAFAQVIDAKSPYTFNHSLGVADASVEIAEAMALAPGVVTMIRRAALLHDIGKLSVSSAILEKPGKLTDQEWKIVKMHPVYSRLILSNISGFEHLAFIAGAHHERLDGKGYPDGLTEAQMPLPARIIAVADVYQALIEKRPYRDGLALDVVFGMMDQDVPSRLDRDCVVALKKRKLASPVRTEKSAQAAGV